MLMRGEPSLRMVPRTATLLRSNCSLAKAAISGAASSNSFHRIPTSPLIPYCLVARTPTIPRAALRPVPRCQRASNPVLLGGFRPARLDVDAPPTGYPPAECPKVIHHVQVPCAVGVGTIEHR